MNPGDEKAQDPRNEIVRTTRAKRAGVYRTGRSFIVVDSTGVAVEFLDSELSPMEHQKFCILARQRQAEQLREAQRRAQAAEQSEPS